VRQLVRDFPYFARAVNVLVDYVVGAGIIFQSRAEKSSGALDTVRGQKIEDAFNFWADEADASGKLHFYELMRLAKRQDLEAGEFLLVKTWSKNKDRYLPFCLQIYEPDWLTTQNDTWDITSAPPPAGQAVSVSGRPITTQTLTSRLHIRQGIEYNPLTGERVAYHFIDPDSWGQTVRIPAENVIHGFETHRPGQLRGISPFAAGVLISNDLHAMMDSELDAAKMASKWLAMVETPDPVGRQLGMGIQTDPVTGQKIEELQNAIIEYLRPGEKINLSSNPRPGDNFIPFIRLILTMFSIVSGVPYELISGDYQGMNYSVGKMVRVDFAQQLKPTTNRHIRQFCRPSVRGFFDSAVLTGKLTLPGYWSNPAPFIRQEWQPPGAESIDPLRETKARIDEISARIRSPQEIIISRGRDPEDVVREISEFEALCKAHNVETEASMQAISTALANNPAAAEKQP
jgi:lambda family phage portal protein